MFAIPLQKRKKFLPSLSPGCSLKLNRGILWVRAGAKGGLRRAQGSTGVAQSAINDSMLCQVVVSPWKELTGEIRRGIRPLVVLRVHPIKQSCVRWWLAHPKSWKSLNLGLRMVRLTAVVAGLWQPKGSLILPFWDCHGRGVFILHKNVLSCSISPFTLCLCLLDSGVDSFFLVLIFLLFLNMLFLYRFLGALSRCLIFSRGRRKLIGVDEEWWRRTQEYEKSTKFIIIIIIKYINWNEWK